MAMNQSEHYQLIDQVISLENDFSAQANETACGHLSNGVIVSSGGGGGNSLDLLQPSDSITTGPTMGLCQPSLSQHAVQQQQVGLIRGNVLGQLQSLHQTPMGQQQQQQQQQQLNCVLSDCQVDYCEGPLGADETQLGSLMGYDKHNGSAAGALLGSLQGSLEQDEDKAGIETIRKELVECDQQQHYSAQTTTAGALMSPMMAPVGHQQQYATMQQQAATAMRHMNADGHQYLAGPSQQQQHPHHHHHQLGPSQLQLSQRNHQIQQQQQQQSVHIAPMVQQQPQYTTLRSVHGGGHLQAHASYAPTSNGTQLVTYVPVSSTTTTSYGAPQNVTWLAQTHQAAYQQQQQPPPPQQAALVDSSGSAGWQTPVSSGGGGATTASLRPAYVQQRVGQQATSVHQQNHQHLASHAHLVHQAPPLVSARQQPHYQQLQAELVVGAARRTLVSPALAPVPQQLVQQGPPLLSGNGGAMVAQASANLSSGLSTPPSRKSPAPNSMALVRLTPTASTATTTTGQSIASNNARNSVYIDENGSLLEGAVVTQCVSNARRHLTTLEGKTWAPEYVEMRSSGSLSQDWLEKICRQLVDHMNHFGICVIDNFLGSLKADLILKEVQRLFSSGHYTKGRLAGSSKPAATVIEQQQQQQKTGGAESAQQRQQQQQQQRAASPAQNNSVSAGNTQKASSSSSPATVAPNASSQDNNVAAIRSDRVIWVDGCEQGCAEINNLIQTLCSVITNSSRLSLYTNNGLDKIVINKRTKAHVACYPGNGTRYIKHVDNPNGDGRVITAIYYLNKNWNTKRDGGLLRMFPAGMDEVANIEPLFDRALFFWSDRRNPHEVLPAYRDRFAITVWYIGESGQVEHLQ